MLDIQQETGPALGWLKAAFGAAAFEPLKLGGAPLVVLAGDPLDLIWANDASCHAFGVTDLSALARLILGAKSGPQQRLETLRARLAPDAPPRLERMRLLQGFALHNVTALCGGAETPLGSGLAIAFPGLGSGSRPWWEAPGGAQPPAPMEDTDAASPPPVDLPALSAAPVGNTVDDLRLRVQAAFGGRDQRRFLWRTDATGRLVQVDDGLFSDMDAEPRPLLHQALAEIIGSFDVEAAARLRDALDGRASWSNIEVGWPIGGGQASVPVTLGAAAHFGPERDFEGFRGFGVADLTRLAPRVPPHPETSEAAPAVAPDPLGLSDRGPLDLPVLPEPEPLAPEPVIEAPNLDPSPQDAWQQADPTPAADLPDTSAGPASEAEPAADRDAEEPAQREFEPVPSFQYIDRQANVVRLWPAPAGPARAGEQPAASNAALHDPVPNDAPDQGVDEPNAEPLPAHQDHGGEGNGGLTSSEHSAFREIALALSTAYPEMSSERPGDWEAAESADAEPLVEDRASGPAQPVEPNLDEDLSRSAAGIVETLPLGLMVLRGSQVLYANPALRDALHCTQNSDLPPGLGEAFSGALPLESEPISVDVPLADGSHVTLLAEGRPIAWTGGEAVLWLLRRSDQGEARAAAPAASVEASGADARQLGALVDAASDAFATIDEAGRILTLNRQGERWFGQDRRRLAGESFTLLLAPESRATAAALLAEVKASDDPGAERARETLARAPDGTSLPLQMALARIGTGVFSAAWRDLSAQKRLERDMARAKREADRVSSQQPEFLAKVSHEIRTPLNAILGFAEIMIDERFGPLGNARYKDYLRDIHASGTQVMNLVNDLLDLSRIEAGRLDLDLAPVDLNRIIASCVAEMQTQAHRERVIMRTSLGARLPAITADEKSVRQIVANLLSNAIRYNEPGGQVIVSSALNDAGSVVLRIKDTGIGMSDTDIAAALEPFRQLSASKQAGGTGLGLPLTKALAGANGASLSIRSRPREGTMVEVTFTATIAPAARVPA